MTNRFLFYVSSLIVVVLAVVIFVAPKPGQQNKTTLDNYLSDNHLLEVVYFHTDWCIWCKPFDPVWNSFVRNFKSENISLSAVDYEANQELAKELKVIGIPSLLIVKDNRKQLIVGPVFPLIYNSQTLTEFISKSEADKVRVWNECELAYFVNEKAVPKEMSCEK